MTSPVKTFAQYITEVRFVLRENGPLGESLFDGMTVWGKYIEVFKNPTHKDYTYIAKGYSGSILTVRAIIYGDDVYAWNQNDAEHAHVMGWLEREHKMSRAKMVTVYIDYTARNKTVQVRLSTFSLAMKYTQAQVNAQAKTLPAFAGLTVIDAQEDPNA